MKVYHKVLILPLIISVFLFGILLLFETDTSPQADSEFMFVGVEWWIRLMFGVCPIWFAGWAIWKAKRNCLILERDMITIIKEGVSYRYRLDEYDCSALCWSFMGAPRISFTFMKDNQVVGKHEAPFSRKARRYLMEELNIRVQTWGTL